MSKSFCPNPWMNIRISYDGSFWACRWQGSYNTAGIGGNVRDTSIMEFFNSHLMNQLRSDMSNDVPRPDICSECDYQDHYGKVSGRQRQLFRAKINPRNFESTLANSSYYPLIDYSKHNAGMTTGSIVDMHVDVSDVCNSACIMCEPYVSTRLASDYRKLSHNKLFPIASGTPTWSRDQTIVNKVAKEICELPNLDYLHLLGGETLFVEPFYTICEALIDSGRASSVIVGTTTNATIFTPRIENIISKFTRGFHLGISIDAVTDLNDYVRYPSRVDEVLENISKFIALRDKYPGLVLTFRVTPNIFTIYYYDELIDYMMANGISSESCNILTNPSQLRMELLPDNLRRQTIDKLDRAVRLYHLTSDQVIDTRNQSLCYGVVGSMTHEYINFLSNFKPPADVELERYKLVSFLKGFESLRGNSILTYAPEFEPFLRSYGY